MSRLLDKSLYKCDVVRVDNTVVNGRTTISETTVLQNKKVVFGNGLLSSNITDISTNQQQGGYTISFQHDNVIDILPGRLVYVYKEGGSRLEFVVNDCVISDMFYKNIFVFYIKLQKNNG